MEEFYIDVTLHRGLTRIQVDEVPPESWAMPNTPEFIIEFYNGSDFLTLTIQLEEGTWYADDAYTLNAEDIKAIGGAISNFMVVHLTAYMGLFIRQFRSPTLN